MTAPPDAAAALAAARAGRGRRRSEASVSTDSEGEKQSGDVDDVAQSPVDDAMHDTSLFRRNIVDMEMPGSPSIINVYINSHKY